MTTTSDSVSPRIAPLTPPYTDEVAEALAKWMPPGAAVEPLGLFRTLARNPHIMGRMRPLGAGILGSHGSITSYEREIVIDRTCARCACAYEWGVHAAVFGPLLEIPVERVRATALAAPDDPLWSEREALLVTLVDELHDTARVSDATWAALAKRWTDVQLIELIVIVGWYHLISFVANAAQVAPEPWATPFPADTQNG